MIIQAKWFLLERQVGIRDLGAPKKHQRIMPVWRSRELPYCRVADSFHGPCEACTWLPNGPRYRQAESLLESISSVQSRFQGKISPLTAARPAAFPWHWKNDSPWMHSPWGRWQYFSSILKEYSGQISSTGFQQAPALDQREHHGVTCKLQSCFAIPRKRMNV